MCTAREEKGVLIELIGEKELSPGCTVSRRQDSCQNLSYAVVDSKHLGLPTNWVMPELVVCGG